MSILNLKRCDWCEKDDLYRAYHDKEWGRAIHDEQKHFEFLLLETMQAGLSWYTILSKRENYRKAFADFDVQKVSKFTSSDIDNLMTNSGIIRNRNKLEAAVINANKFIEIQQEFDSFDKYIWSFSNFEIIDNQPISLADIPVKSELSDIVTKDLKKRGFKFVGSITIYSHLQAIGIINDHLISCHVRNLLVD